MLTADFSQQVTAGITAPSSRSRAVSDYLG
jgi:hypothetical protein